MDNNKDIWDNFNKYYYNNIGRAKGKTQALNFHLKILVKIEVQKIVHPDDFKNYNYLIDKLPPERNTDLIGLILVGFKLKEAFDTLKETYKF